VVLIYASVVDVKTRIISNKLCIVIAIIGVINGAKLAGLFVALIVLIIVMTTDGIGGGDVKLIAAISLYTGLVNGLVMLFVACLIQLIFFLFANKLFRKNVVKLPFVPFLTIGYFATLLM